MSDEKAPAHLLTKYVFIDTQAYRGVQFDWNGHLLSKILLFAKAGIVRVLINDITHAEVIARLREMFNEAAAATKKHQIVLRQLGASDGHHKLSDETAAIAALKAAFDKFLKDVQATNVPIKCDLNSLIDDYFSRRPPFSEKKKAEFPDAVVVASLRKWCEKSKATVYVVSGDPDLEACCTQSGPLYYARSIADIISRATVSEKVRAKLERALSRSDALKDQIAEQITDKGVDVRSHSYRHRHLDDVTVLSGKVERVDDVSVHYVNVLDQDGKRFTCEIECEAEIVLDLYIEFEPSHGWPEEDAPPMRQRVSETIIHLFSAEVVLEFDVEEGVNLESVYVYGDEVEIEARELKQLSRRRF